jgi:steroid 5-alpha reductase family enzyme
LSIGELLLATAAWSAVSMTALWLLSLALRDASIVDIWWGPGFAAITAVAYALAASGHPRQTLMLTLVAAWGLRLGLYLFARSRGHGEDPRYQAMRRSWGARFPLVSLFTVFGLQGLLMWFISLPMQLTQADPGGPLGLLDAIGCTVFVAGLAFESIGDFQLARFRASRASEGQVLEGGLWRFTRHPNYFGDAVVHAGIFLVALGGPFGAWTFLSPAVMWFFLMRVSGVPMIERSIGKRRPGYAAYQARTNAFFPGPPKRNGP